MRLVPWALLCSCPFGLLPCCPCPYGLLKCCPCPDLLPVMVLLGFKCRLGGSLALGPHDNLAPEHGLAQAVKGQATSP